MTDLFGPVGTGWKYKVLQIHRWISICRSNYQILLNEWVEYPVCTYKTMLKKNLMMVTCSMKAIHDARSNKHLDI